MRKRNAAPDAPFQRPADAARLTGIPVSHIRAGTRDGSIPCQWFGRSCLVNMPAYLRQLGVIETAPPGMDEGPVIAGGK